MEYPKDSLKLSIEKLFARELHTFFEQEASALRVSMRNVYPHKGNGSVIIRAVLLFVILSMCRTTAAFTISPMRIDTRVVNITASGTELVGTPDGGNPTQWNTCLLPDGLTDLSSTLKIIVINQISAEAGRLTSNVTWSADTPYLVRHDVIIPDGITLTLKKDAVVLFSDGARFWVETGGRIVSEGAQLASLSENLAEDGTLDLAKGVRTTMSSEWWWDDPESISIESWQKPKKACVSLDSLGLVRVGFNDGITDSASARVYTANTIDICYENLPDLEREGYVFKGWYASVGGKEVQISKTTPIIDGVSSIYAKWEEIPTYTISFDANGGFGEMSSLFFKQSSQITIPKNIFTWDGCDFMGWSTNDTDNVAFEDEAQIILESDMTFHAVWRGDLDLAFYWPEDWLDSAFVALSSNSSIPIYHATCNDEVNLRFAIANNGSFPVEEIPVNFAFIDTNNQILASIDIPYSFAPETLQSGYYFWEDTLLGELEDLEPGNYTLRLTIDTGDWMGGDVSPADNTTYVRFVIADSGITISDALDCTELSFSSTEGRELPVGISFMTADGEDAVQFGPFAHGATNAICTTVTGPGSISFCWRTSSEPEFDKMRFILDGEEIYSKCGISTEWEELVHFIDEGEHSLEWCYIKDSSVSVGLDCGWLDNVKWEPSAPIIFSFNSMGGTEIEDIMYYSGSCYGNLPEPTRVGYEFVGWWSAEEGGEPINVDDNVLDQNSTLFARWSLLEGAADLRCYWPVGWPANLFFVVDQTSTDAIYHMTTSTLSYVRYAVANNGLVSLNDIPVTLTIQDAKGELCVAKNLTHTLTDSLPPGYYFGAFPFWSPFNNLEPGNYILRLNIDAENCFNETNRVNNVASCPFVIRGENVSLADALDCFDLEFHASDGVDAPYGETFMSADGVDAVQFGPQANNMTNYVSSTVIGPGVLSFKWRVSSEGAKDKLWFLIDDGEWWSYTSGTNSEWRTFSRFIAEGAHNVEWRYTKDGSGFAGQDCGWVDQVVWTPSASVGVVFNSNGGSTISNITCYSGSNYGNLPSPSRTGYQFAGWWTAASGGERITSTSTIPNEDVVLYAHWTPNTYRVTLDYDGATTPVANTTISVQYATTFSVAAPAKTGFVFIGWTATSGLNRSTARYGTSATWLSSIWSSTTYFANGSSGNVYFMNLSAAQQGEVVLKANWIDSGVKLSTALDAPNLMFNTGGSANWFGQSALSYDSSNAARSGVICDGQSSWLSTTVNGEGTLSFWWKTSSESSNCDYVEFFVDDVSQGKIGGNSLVWQQKAVVIAGTGVHVLKWVYKKDSSISSWDDCAWVDRVVWVETDPIPELPLSATATDVITALQGSADIKLMGNITDAATYSAYREWAQTVKGVDGKKLAGKQTVKDSTKAWLSFALGTDVLLGRELVFGDVKIGSFTPSTTEGKFEFNVSVKDVNIGGGSVAEGILKANLKKVFEVEGANSLSPGAFSSDNIDIIFDTPVDGKAKFTVSPPSDAGDSFFMRVKVK